MSMASMMQGSWWRHCDLSLCRSEWGHLVAPLLMECRRTIAPKSLHDIDVFSVRWSGHPWIHQPCDSSKAWPCLGSSHHIYEEPFVAHLHQVLLIQHQASLKTHLWPRLLAVQNIRSIYCLLYPPKRRWEERDWGRFGYANNKEGITWVRDWPAD